jgi:hypothetical protein
VRVERIDPKLKPHKDIFQEPGKTNKHNLNSVEAKIHTRLKKNLLLEEQVLMFVLLKRNDKMMARLKNLNKSMVFDLTKMILSLNYFLEVMHDL